MTRNFVVCFTPSPILAVQVNDTTRLKMLLDNVPGLIAYLDRDNRYQLASRSHLTWFGIAPGTLAGLHVSEVMGEQAWQLLKPHYEQAVSGDTATYMGEVHFAQGGRRYVHSTVMARRDVDGQVLGVLAMTTDLTEHKLMEKALDASTRRARAVLETAVDGIITIDARGTVESFNRGAEIQFGYSAAEVVGRNVKILMPAAYAEQHDQYLQRYSNTGERHIIGIGREVTARRKDGSEFPIELAVGEFMEGGARYFTGFTRDISDRKAAELEARARHNQLSHSARLNSLGELAASIAHEVNQPLTAIVAMTQALLRYMDQDADTTQRTRETLNRIVKQGKRAGDVIQHIRAFVQGNKSVERELHDVNVIIRNALQLVEYEFEQNRVRLDAGLEPQISPVHVNGVQIEQVVVNLVQNAVQAMAGNERERVLSIISQTQPGDGREIEIRVEDTGHGLPDGEESRVFEPFFTTRVDGMGQGLSISKSIVEAHGGTIRAVRNDGPGATFVVTLPAGKGA